MNYEHHTPVSLIDESCPICGFVMGPSGCPYHTNVEVMREYVSRHNKLKAKLDVLVAAAASTVEQVAAAREGYPDVGGIRQLKLALEAARSDP